MKLVQRILFFILLLSVVGSSPASATHVVGGEVTYVYLGNNVYRIRVDIYRDCINGDPQAISQDDPAYLSVFSGDGSRIRSDSTNSADAKGFIIPDNFSNACINNKPNTCLNRITFFKNYSLPASPKGYYIVYQRCCRNATILNIVNPGSTGATYYCVIPPSNESGKVVNNSAVFKNYPPQIICINNPLFYDHSATDADGDSLSYEFCTAYNGGSANDAKPVPTSLAFPSVYYYYPYTAKQPMGNGNASLKIDPKTGLITGTPSQLGRYVVTVCCHEWRNGVIINTVTREFQFVVTPCSKAVVANIPQLSSEFNTFIVQCKGYTVQFKNLSAGANSTYDAYSWDFGVLGILSDTSHLKEPQYTYPDTGTYIVKLVVNRGSTCTDSITRFVKVYPDFNVDFDFTGLPCPLTPIQFINKTTSTYKPVYNYDWDFGDGTGSTDFEPKHVYDTGGSFVVILRASNIKGCYDSAVKKVDIGRFKAFAGNDTIIVKGESIIFNATGGNAYTWTPATNLNNPNISDPIGYYPDTGRYVYAVHVSSPGGCEGDDTIKVWVVGQGAIFVPSAFSPNGDGQNDVLRPIGVGYRNEYTFRVYNRWGQPVFYSSRFGDGWDGKYQGKTADVGTYYWFLSIKDRYGKMIFLKGDSALIR